MADVLIPTMRNINVPRAGDIWKHYKGGRYRIHAVGFNEYGKPVVIYHSAEESTTYFTRDLSTFLEVLDVTSTEPGSRYGTDAKEPRFKFFQQRQ